MSDDAIRLDIAMTQRGITTSRSRAKALIDDGKVCLNGVVCKKTSQMVSIDDTITLCGESLKYVSRGGYKLEKAVDTFNLSLQNRVCMDVGASTGGFTDCMLQNGAKTVYAVDVGTDQLAPVLRSDKRVIVREQCNFRYMTPQDIDFPLDFASVDVSFISLTVILPVLYNLLKPGADAVCLIKPQFEAGREAVGKNGVVKKVKDHLRVLADVTSFMINSGFRLCGLTYSPIKGPKGNIEYLAWIQRSPQPGIVPDLSDIVNEAHQILDGE